MRQTYDLRFPVFVVSGALSSVLLHYDIAAPAIFFAGLSVLVLLSDELSLTVEKDDK